MCDIIGLINHPKERLMDKLYIVIPAYNEQDNIEQVIKMVSPVWLSLMTEVKILHMKN